METYGNRERSILRRFFVNENEDQAIRRKMGEAGIRNFSTFARYMLLTGRVQVINFEELSKLRQEINRVGVNINQIARQVNTNEEASREELVAVLEQLQEIEELIEGKIEEAEKGE
ncbi:plasmid mobilization protein [Streptococcus sanguinis]|uniref:plasmid mobilization protein n=1 Tax=Streptococcus sanguinis TaxID=1305 RepID=UPI001CBB361C|nr:plasmid mobilization relaxosome protein MobC [Streptococcus sanguinis]